MKFSFYEQAPKEIVAFCNLCGQNEFELVQLKDRYGLEAPTARCKGCGLVFLSYRMTPEAYREFYEGGHYRQLLSEWLGKPVTAASIEKGQIVYAEGLARWLLPHIGKVAGGLLLDLGGSTGITADTLSQAFNLDATVVEPSIPEAERARSKGLAVAPVPLEEYEAGGNHYDLITLCQTVDHLLDIRAALAKVRQWLAPKGLFFVDFVTVRQYKIDHPYYLSKATMREYLKRAGFEVLVMQPARDQRHMKALCTA